MARLQILELPEGSGDDRPPFVLVVDEASEDIAKALTPTDSESVSHATAIQKLTGLSIAEQIGARAVLVFEDTIDIPANDTTAYVGAPAAEQEIVVKLDDHDVRAVIAADVQKMRDAHDEATNVRDKDAELRAANEWVERLHAEARTAHDALSRWKGELLDALGMDRTRDWDDIRNAAAGLRKSNDARGEAIDRVLSLPYQPDAMDAQHAEPTGYQHGYRIAIQDAKRAVGHQSEHPTEKQARA
jgi:hypothetical protein